MKIAIVVAGLFVVVIAALVAIQPGFLKPASLAEVKKSDILGFSPGMTAEETSKVITQRRYRCTRLRDTFVLECPTDDAKLTIESDAIDTAHPIRRITASLKNPGSSESAVTSISRQFNAQPTKDAGEAWTWIVGRGLKLSFDGASLTLADQVETNRRK